MLRSYPQFTPSRTPQPTREESDAGLHVAGLQPDEEGAGQ